MILEAIFDLIKIIILFVVNLFPPLPDMDFLVIDFKPLTDVLTAVNSFVSIPLFSWCCVTLVVFLNIEFIWSIIIWVVKKIPGVS